MAALTSIVMGVGAALGIGASAKAASAQRDAARKQQAAMRAQEEQARTIARNQAALRSSTDSTGARIQIGAQATGDAVEKPGWGKGKSKRTTAAPALGGVAPSTSLLPIQPLNLGGRR